MRSKSFKVCVRVVMLNSAQYVSMYNTAKKITNRAKWFRSIKPGDVSEGLFLNSLKFNSISVQLTDFNRTIGREKGVFIHAKYFPEKSCIILVGVSLEERERELSDCNYIGNWRNYINMIKK